MMAYASVSPEDLIAKFQYALDNKWGYIWGKAGDMWTEAKQENLNKTTDEERAQSRRYGSKWIGHYVADCSGLFYWAFKQLGSYMYHGSNTMWNKYCTNKGKLKGGRRADGTELKPGTAVFVYNPKMDNRSHVGLYIGHGTVIEAASSYSGVITTKVTNSKWTEWGELKYVNYAHDSNVVGNPTVRRGSNGEAVTKLQKLLKEAGYLSGEVDGVFGAQTETAVRNFQGSRGLAADGIVGPKTWSALEKTDAESPVRTVRSYSVTINGVTKDQADQLKKQYPQAVII